MLSFSRRLGVVAVLSPLLMLSASVALAFDCTPISTIPVNGTTVGGQMGVNAVPGEPVCGTDYTGQNFYVYDFTLAQASSVVFLLATGGQAFGDPPPPAELFVLANCDPNACMLTYAGQGGATSDPICLGAGTYTLVVASPDTDTSHSYGTAVGVVDTCTPIPVDGSSWGTLKNRF